ncbi:MAG: hypothetical protein A2V88_08315 [Elusimicrobia bacterium RBG_16_66_12]|nr:MAG: hypothetical protein A2V88_08315 [Elusimicrobia bacterium RBG_16_66_12]
MTNNELVKHLRDRIMFLRAALAVIGAGGGTAPSLPGLARVAVDRDNEIAKLEPAGRAVDGPRSETVSPPLTEAAGSPGVGDGERSSPGAEPRDSGARGAEPPAVTDMTTETQKIEIARLEFVLVAGESGSDSLSEEQALLSVDRRCLPACALAVLDGGERTVEYYQWCREQTLQAQAEHG